jgi:hypothetical protein
LNHVSTETCRMVGRMDIPQVAHCAGVTKHLSTNRHVSTAIRVVDRSWLPGAGSPSNSPSCGSRNENDCDTKSVLHPGSGALSLLENVAKAVTTLGSTSGASATGSTTASSATREAEVFLLVGEQRGVLVDGSVLSSGDRALTFATGIQGVVVDGKGDDSGHEISPKSTGEVGDVSGHPY